MAWCDLCRQDDGFDAKPGEAIPDSCVPNEIAHRYGVLLRRTVGLMAIPYGHEAEGWIDITPPDRCHDCRVKIGGFHHPGCDVERCPVCIATDGWGAFAEARRMGQHGKYVQAMLCAHCKNRRRIE